MLAQRVLTAVVLVLILLGSLAWSTLAFAAVLTAFITIALAEWLQLAGWGRSIAVAIAATLGLALFGLEAGHAALPELAAMPLAVVASGVWFVVALLLPGRDGPRLPIIPPVIGLALAIVLATATWSAVMYFLRQGPMQLLSLAALVWIADIAAYFVGRAFGKRKLAPAISPGKTWAGLYGGVLGVLGVSLLAWHLAPELPFFSNRLFNSWGAPLALLVLVFLVLASVVGDLFESLLKRRAAVKDSSHLLPGHGGFYDRIDALIPVLPLAVVLEAWGR